MGPGGVLNLDMEVAVMQDDSLFVDLEGGMTALVSASASVWRR